WSRARSWRTGSQQAELSPMPCSRSRGGPSPSRRKARRWPWGVRWRSRVLRLTGRLAIAALPSALGAPGLRSLIPALGIQLHRVRTPSAGYARVGKSSDVSVGTLATGPAGGGTRGLAGAGAGARVGLGARVGDGLGRGGASALAAHDGQEALDRVHRVAGGPPGENHRKRARPGQP